MHSMAQQVVIEIMAEYGVVLFLQKKQQQILIEKSSVQILFQVLSSHLQNNYVKIRLTIQFKQNGVILAIKKYCCFEIILHQAECKTSENSKQTMKQIKKTKIENNPNSQVENYQQSSLLSNLYKKSNKSQAIIKQIISLLTDKESYFSLKQSII
ncbi:unnamed protein product [Paramecium sonneborni]|uniref:Uncharacterized protein n=1 Tax=Paramecium sonneborni TaxID=65129 RepID=A0A8S1N842_9CILI|nr:unnamed protein product [Paramecium sonneborni]